MQTQVPASPRCRLPCRSPASAHSCTRPSVRGRPAGVAHAGTNNDAALPEGWVAPGAPRPKRQAAGKDVGGGGADGMAGESTRKLLEGAWNLSPTASARMDSGLGRDTTKFEQYVRSEGKVALVDAYAKYLGRHRALSACMSNEVMLQTTNSPAQVEAVFTALATALGEASAKAVVQREPSVLYQKPDTVNAVVTALGEALGAEGARHALFRNPTLMQPNRDSHVLGALQALATVFGGDEQLANQLVRRNTLLLGTRASTILGAFEALNDLFGQSEALQLASQHPGLLRSMPMTMRGALEELAIILGSAEAAYEAVRQNSALLKARRSTMQDSWATLCTLFGKATALDMVNSQLGLLRSRASTLRASHDALVLALGPANAPTVIAATPVLLQCRHRVIEFNWNALSSTVGPDRGHDIAMTVPHVLAFRLGRLPELLALLLDIFSGSSDSLASAHGPVFRCPPAKLANRWASIIRRCGNDEVAAKTLVASNSRLLTCTENVLDARIAKAV